MTEGQSLTQQFIALVEGQTLQLAPELATDLVNGQTGLVVALSGGSDSTALLLAMSSVCRKYSWKLWAAHINHGIRGADSGADETFCRKLCDRLNIEFGSVKLKLAPSSTAGNEPKQRFSEEELRQARYEELAQMAKLWGARYVLLGHTFDDQTETMLFHLFRGTGLSGLRGMPARRDVADSITLLRPLFNMRRADCRCFLQELGQDWVEDSTNDQDHYTRNYIRHHVIPAIEARFPKFQDSAAGLRQIVSEAEEYLDDATAKAQNEIQVVLSEKESITLGLNYEDICEIWSIDGFKSQMPILRKQLIASALKRLGVIATTKRIQNLHDLLVDGSDTTDSTMSLGPELRVRLCSQYVLWEELDSETFAHSLGNQAVIFPGTTAFPILNKSLSIEKSESDCGFPHNSSAEALADFTNAVFPLVIRTRKAGDIIQPLGMKEKVKLKKFIHTRKLHLNTVERASLAVLADQEEVLWVPGVGMSEKIRVKNQGSAYHLNWSDIASEKALNVTAAARQRIVRNNLRPSVDSA